MEKASYDERDFRNGKTFFENILLNLYKQNNNYQ